MATGPGLYELAVAQIARVAACWSPESLSVQPDKIQAAVDASSAAFDVLLACFLSRKKTVKIRVRPVSYKPFPDPDLDELPEAQVALPVTQITQALDCNARDLLQIKGVGLLKAFRHHRELPQE